MTTSRILLEQGHQRLIRGRHGYVLYNRNDIVIGRLIERYGEYFESEVDVFRRFVSPGDIVADIGANIGTHTMALAGLVGPGGFVYAFEPQRIVFQTLAANMALNSLDNVHCVNAALDETTGWLALTDPDPATPNNFGGAQLAQISGAPRAPRVACLALDDFLDVDRLRLVKIDVEGMESAVLRGGRRIISALRPVLYVENAFPDKSPELIGLLGELGYRCFWHLPPYFARNNYFADPDPEYPLSFVDGGGVHLDCIGIAINLLCVHPSHGAQIQGLRPVASPGEHPLRRECVDEFSAGAGGIPVIRQVP